MGLSPCCPFEFCLVCVFMAVFSSFRGRVTRSGGFLQKEWRLSLPVEERSMLKQRRFQRVQDGAGGREKEITELGNLQLNRET